MKRFLICLTVVFMALALVNCKLGSIGGGTSGKPGHKPGKPEPPPVASQGIYKIEITQQLSPAFGGQEFGDVGTYDKYLGWAYGVLDPNDPRNQIITDITLADKNADGMVEYSTKFLLITPTNPAKGSKVLFDIPNRGNLTFSNFNQGGGSSTTFGDTALATANSSTIPQTPATYPGFIFNTLGYSYMSVAWDMEPGSTGATSMGTVLPIAKNPDGSSIVGPMYEWLTGSGRCLTAYYEPANSDPGYATLTKRNHLTDTPEIISPSDWSWGGSCASNGISLNSGDNFQNNWIYELEYTAKDPYVAAAGFAAMRDAVEFLRYATADSLGTPNPVAGRLEQIVVFTSSQPGRGMNDFVWLGFNEDSMKRKVFDGTMNYIGGGDGMGINYRFAQVGRTERARQNHIAQLEGVFPLSYTTTTDPFSGKTDGRNVRCTASDTCPKVMNIYASNEMWVKSASLATSDPGTGHDVAEPANVRNYQIAGAQHGASGSSPAGGVSATATNQFANTTVDSMPVYRALWVAMDKWISEGVLPPASRVPSVDEGTAAFVPTDNGAINVLGIGMIPMASLGFPNMPDELFNVPSKSIVVTVRPFWNFGPRYDQGILDIVPPVPTGGFYKTFVAKVDNTGNEIGALRLPEVEAPIGSNLGWTLRAIGYGGKLEGTDGSDGSGGFIPLAPFAADAAAIGDGRKSLEELYAPGGTMEDIKAAWLAKRIAAAQALYEQGFLLEKDRDNYETSGKLALSVGANAKYPSMYSFSLPASP